MIDVTDSEFIVIVGKGLRLCAACTGASLVMQIFRYGR